jgi:hypothetical protein
LLLGASGGSGYLLDLFEQGTHIFLLVYLFGACGAAERSSEASDSALMPSMDGALMVLCHVLCRWDGAAAIY